MNIGKESLLCGETFVHFSQVAYVTLEPSKQSQGDYDSIAVYGHDGRLLTGAIYQTESGAEETSTQLSNALQSYYDKR